MLPYAVLSPVDKIHHSKRWWVLSKRMRARYPLCFNPYGLHDTVELSEQVHHVRPVETHPQLAFDETNLVPVCGRCHQHIEMLVGRGVDTVDHLFWRFRDFWKNPLALAVTPHCYRLEAMGVYCHRMKCNRLTKCGGCTDL